MRYEDHAGILQFLCVLHPLRLTPKFAADVACVTKITLERTTLNAFSIPKDFSAHCSGCVILSHGVEESREE